MEQRPQIPPALRPYADAARTLGARRTRESLGPGRSSSRLDDLARRLQREFDRMAQQKFDSLPGTGEVACSAGCDHCCRTLPVMVSPIEVFIIVHRVRDTHGSDPAPAATPASAAPIPFLPVPCWDRTVCAPCTAPGPLPAGVVCQPTSKPAPPVMTTSWYPSRPCTNWERAPWSKASAMPWTH